jgi:fibrillarin-like rRNA methylase
MQERDKVRVFPEQARRAFHASNPTRATRRLDAKATFPSRQAYRRHVIRWARRNMRPRWNGRTSDFTAAETAYLNR